ncbi:MAG: class I SAM-dependent methyltransferase [Herminiimonas sp.]|nr:class I SAM-dependent methyltransferase [Herminiimonas sp.]
MEHQSSQKSIIALGPWLETAAGRYVLAWEQSRLDALTTDIFGFNAMQIGLPQINALHANRMPHQWQADIRVGGDAVIADAGADAAASNAAPAIARSSMPVSVVLDYAELPFASQSLDLVVLPHVLEFAAEPHQVLREVERVLIPEGQLIVCGFNPASLWGARQLAGRLTNRPFLPRDGEFISPRRMKDWLKLLNMEVDRGHFGCYAPPCSTEKWLQRYAFMEEGGKRWWPYLGAVYMMHAIKRVKGMRLVGPVWTRDPVKAPHAIPVTNRSNRDTNL